MAISPRTIKVLWGRSASRCAICRTELVLAGTSCVIGQHAHIVASKSDGPRGQSDLPLAERDSYDNLILLCPNHHVEIDRDVEKWTVEDLRRQKRNHEEWAERRLDEGRIVPGALPTENPAHQALLKFEERSESWSYVAVSALAPPLEELDVTTPGVASPLYQYELPRSAQDPLPINVNPADVRTDSLGLVWENSRFLEQHGVGTRLRATRGGHFEYALCLEGELRRFPRRQLEDLAPRERPSGLDMPQWEDPPQRFLKSERWFEMVASQLNLVTKLFQASRLVAEDLLVTIALTRFSDATLLAGHGPSYVGAAADTSPLTFEGVIDSSSIAKDALRLGLKHLLQSLSLVLRADGDTLSGWTVAPFRLERSR